MHQADYKIGGCERAEEVLRALVLRYRPEVFFAGDLQIHFHQNTCTMVSLSRKGRSHRLRLHRLFTRAPQTVLEAVVQSFFTRARRTQARRFRERILDFLERNQDLPAANLSPVPLGTAGGRVHDLNEIQDTIRKEFLPQCPRLHIGWSRRATPSLMGKWIAMPAGVPSVVVVNRLLDCEQVPRYYVQYIVFHELLHELIPIRRQRGRWVHHPIEFRRLERQFPYFSRALRWERDNVVRLFASCLRAAGRH